MNRAVVLSLLTLLFTLNVRAEVRTWTNASGTVVEADYVSQSCGKVKIRRVGDNQVFEIPIDTLSQVDRDWLAGQNKPAGSGLYIAVGNGLHRMSSNDGRTWTNHVFVEKPGHNQNDLKAIAVGNGVCVVVGGFSKSNILTTSDGVGWDITAFNMGVLSGVIFREGQFHAFGEGGKVAASKDGKEWKVVGDAKLRDHLTAEAQKLGLAEPIKSNIRRWRQVNGVFVGAGDNCILLSTRDFQTWHFAERIEPQSRLFIESDAAGFVVHGDRTLHYSKDGIKWIEVTPELDEQAKFSSLTHDGERFLVNTRDGRGWESKDGLEWRELKGQIYPGTIAALRPDLLYSFETYWKYTEDLKVSTDGGKSWASCTLPAPAGVTNLIFAEGFPSF